MCGSGQDCRGRAVSATQVQLRRSDIRMAPLFCAVWVGTWWSILHPGGWRWGCAGFLAASIGILSIRRRPWPLIAAIVATLAAGVLTGSLHTTALHHSGIATAASQHLEAEVTVRTRTDPREMPAAGARQALASIEGVTQATTIDGQALDQRVPLELKASGDSAAWLVAVPAGSLVTVQGRLSPAQPDADLAAVLTVRVRPIVLESPSGIDAGINRLRSGLRSAMAWAPQPVSGLVPSLVVGDTSRLADSLTGAFKATGLTHITAVSGTNLTLVLAFLLTLARWCGVRGWWLRGTGLIGIAGFVLVCRSEPSVLRAAAMGLVALAGVGWSSGRGRALRNLSVAGCVLLLWDPWLARSTGFALSVLATGGIAWWSDDWQQRMSQWAPAWLAETVCVPCAAQLATQPLVTSISGNISVVSLACNGLAAPFVGPATVVGLVTGLVSLLSHRLALPLGWAAGWAVRPLIWIAGAGASLPAATWQWTVTPESLAVLTGLCLVGGLLVGRIVSHPWLCAVMGLCLVTASLRAPTPVGWPGAWEIVFCDVGQGDATIARAGPGAAVMVDVGPDTDASVRCLRSLGITSIPLLVLTHYHADHAGALDQVLAHCRVTTLLLNPVRSPQPAAVHVLASAARFGIHVAEATAGQNLAVGDLTWHTISVDTAAADSIGSVTEGESAGENDTSIIGRITIGSLDVLVAGDAEPAGQAAAIATGESLAAEVLKMPHHGSAKQSADFWSMSHARIAVASAGLHNDYGHPAAAALRLASRLGMTVARTDLEGSIAVSLTGDRVLIRTQRSPPSG